MIDRGEFIRFRIENYLDERRARLKKVLAGTGTLVVRQASNGGAITVGAFASSRWEFKRGDRHHFIETPIPGGDNFRQLWLPAERWDGPYTVVRQREIMVTIGQSARRFAAWQDVYPMVGDVAGYSAYNPENQAIFDEAELTLQFMDANDDSFEFSVEED